MTKKNDETAPPVDVPAESAPGVLTEAEAYAVAYRYVGNGDSVVGIPARDLTVIDIENLDVGLRREVYMGRLYQAV
jgi:hypothetical protein